MLQVDVAVVVYETIGIEITNMPQAGRKGFPDIPEAFVVDDFGNISFASPHGNLLLGNYRDEIATQVVENIESILLSLNHLLYDDTLVCVHL